MNKILSGCIVIATFSVIVVLSFCAPYILNDTNTFLKEFVGSQFLGFLGVVVTITLASAANIHFELNKLADKCGKDIFTRSRKALINSVHLLIYLLLFSVFLVVFKSLINIYQEGVAFVNGLAILIVIINVIVLIDLTQMAFEIKPSDV